MASFFLGEANTGVFIVMETFKFNYLGDDQLGFQSPHDSFQQFIRSTNFFTGVDGFGIFLEIYDFFIGV